MERKVPFEVDEYYHLFTRGVDKKVVLPSIKEYERFLLLLFLCNTDTNVRVGEKLRLSRGEPLQKLFENEPKRERLVDVVAYALMPNHLHLIVHEKQKGGISKFMLKLMTAYSMYFNTKYERSGPLFTRPFRSKHIDTDDYFQWVFSYVLLNPLEMFQPGWKERGLPDIHAAASYLQTYQYGSFPDYYVGDRSESCILTKEALPLEVCELHTIDDLLAALARSEGKTLV